MNDSPQTYSGIYVSHWEVGRFVVETGRKFFGLVPRMEKWIAIFPDGYKLPFQDQPPTGRDDGHYFNLTVKGVLGPKGRYGHRGIGRRQLQITEVTSCEETDSPGKTW